MNLAFSVAKSGLSIVPTLVHPDTSAKVSLSVDASSSHIRAVLQQDVAGSWAPLAFYSKKLSSTRSRYSTIDQDLLFRSALVCHAAAQPVFPLRIQLWYYSSPWCTEYDSWCCTRCTFLSKKLSLINSFFPNNVIISSQGLLNSNINARLKLLLDGVK